MKKYKKFILIGIMMVICVSIFAQSSNGDILTKIQQKNNADEGEVLIFQDMRINDLVYNHIEQNKRKGGIPGYRIRIFSDLGNTARDESQVTKAKFYELFPEIPIYREYDSPYFKVYVGDFRTKVDAIKVFKQIKRYFPAAFIVPDQINYPNLEE